MIEVKKMPLVLVPFALIVVGLFALVFAGKITWAECIGGLVLLNVPTMFGLVKGGSK
jgi:hypothetical protein